MFVNINESVCLIVRLYFCLLVGFCNNLGILTGRFLEIIVMIGLDFAEIKNVLFINDLGSPTGKFSENFRYIRFDLTEIL